MKLNAGLYSRAKQDANYISEILTQMEFLSLLAENGVTNPASLRKDYEERKLKEIKNAITNIYLILDLHEVRGMADEIYNKDWKGA